MKKTNRNHEVTSKKTFLLIYEGRLGSNRADSTFVLKNAKNYDLFVETKIITSNRTNWQIPSDILKKFSVRSISKPFNPKTLRSSIYNQLYFGLQLRKLLYFYFRNTSSNYVTIFHDWWPILPLLLIQKNRLKIVLEIHRSLPKFLFKLRLVNHVDLFIATNEIKYLELKPLLVDRIILERNAVDLSDYELTDSIHSPSTSTFSVIYTGSLQKDKNPNMILEIAKLIPEIDFVIIGNPPIEWSKISIPTNLFLVGIVDHDLIPQIQMSADVLLVTLEGSNEQSSKYTSTMKLFEYIAARRPIVAPRLPSILDIVSEEYFHGYESNDLSSLKEVLINLYTRKLTPKIPDTAKMEEFSWLKRNERIYKYLNSNF